MMTLQQLHQWLPGSTLLGDGQTPVQRVHTDTRSIRVGDLFVALKGERFDAHDFLPQAKAAGAVALLAEHGVLEAGLPGVQVASTGQALLDLGAAWRRQFDLPVIAVTGSNGKTTVTQMIASILRAWQGDAAFWTHGNLNNEIGVPMTVLNLRAHHRVAVIELGMNHPGEIERLTRVAQPTVALVNNAQREHQEFMGTVEAVAHENGSVIDGLPLQGVAVFPADDRYTSVWQKKAGPRRTMTFALDAEADVTGHATWTQQGWEVQLNTPAGTAMTTLRIAGLHNVKNALAATACALAAGCPLMAVVQGLKAFEPVKGRSVVKMIERHGSTVALIDDTYNANPDSVRAAIDVLHSLPEPRWLVLGDMGEVGTQGAEYHQEVGAYARERGINHLWAVGDLSAHAAQAFPAATHFKDVQSAVKALTQAPAAQSILVKGSRFMTMEKMVEALVLNSQDPHSAGVATC